MNPTDRWRTVASIVLGGLFLVAGALKLPDPAAFSRTIAGFDLLPLASVTLIAVLLPAVELCAGAALLHTPLRYGASLIAALLSLSFLVASFSAWIRGLDPVCGCFGPESGRVGGISFLVEGTVLVLSCVIFRGEQRRIPA